MHFIIFVISLKNVKTNSYHYPTREASLINKPIKKRITKMRIQIIRIGNNF